MGWCQCWQLALLVIICKHNTNSFIKDKKKLSAVSPALLPVFDLDILGYTFTGYWKIPGDPLLSCCDDSFLPLHNRALLDFVKSFENFTCKYNSWYSLELKYMKQMQNKMFCVYPLITWLEHTALDLCSFVCLPNLNLVCFFFYLHNIQWSHF